jgi:hypothetical protein
MPTIDLPAGELAAGDEARPRPMIRIAITQAAFDAIARTLPAGSVAYEPAGEEGGMRYVWLEARWLDRLSSYRALGESFSDAILRLAAAEG